MKEGGWERLGSRQHWSPRQEGGLLTAVFGGEGRPLSQDNADPCSWNLPVFLDTQRRFFLSWWAKALSNSVLTGRRAVQVRKPSWGGWGGFPSLAHGLLALAPGMVHQKLGGVVVARVTNISVSFPRKPPRIQHTEHLWMRSGHKVQRGPC